MLGTHEGVSKTELHIRQMVARSDLRQLSGDDRVTMLRGCYDCLRTFSVPGGDNVSDST